MSRRKTDPRDIQNPEHYFNRYVALESRKDRIRQREYDSFFCSLDSKLSERSLSMQRYLAINDSYTDLEAQMIARNPLSWISYIESPALFQVLSGLPRQQQLLLTYRYYFCLTQRETAKLLGCSQSAVLRCEKRLLHNLKNALDR